MSSPCPFFSIFTSFLVLKDFLILHDQATGQLSFQLGFLVLEGLGKAQDNFPGKGRREGNMGIEGRCLKNIIIFEVVNDVFLQQHLQSLLKTVV